MSGERGPVTRFGALFGRSGALVTHGRGPGAAGERRRSKQSQTRAAFDIFSANAPNTESVALGEDLTEGRTPKALNQTRESEESVGGRRQETALQISLHLAIKLHSNDIAEIVIPKSERRHEAGESNESRGEHVRVERSPQKTRGREK